MKFGWKIFFVTFLITVISFGAGGFLLINSVFTSSYDSKVLSVRENNSYITASLYAVVNSTMQSEYYTDVNLKNTISNFTKQMSSDSEGTIIKIGSKSDMDFYSDESFINTLSPNERGYDVFSDGGVYYIQAVSCLELYDSDYYVESLCDISELYYNRDEYYKLYQIILMCVALSASVVLLIFVFYATKPLSSLSRVSREIADGDFSKRAEINRRAKGTLEIYELSNSFNTMAQYVEDYIEELKREAQSRDDFVANFTHELKTPLTSVIGYADMLRSYELDSKQTRECADCIYSEGKRLESLALNLLDILVLQKEEIKLTPVKTDKLFSDTGKSVAFILKKYKIRLEIDYEPCTVLAEPSLIKTLLYNLIDNACKAYQNSRERVTAPFLVELVGVIENDRYKISVTDHGCGIPKSELDKITQPFYMVDKSRSRSMGGAGLGLALCKEIAQLHRGELKFTSEQGRGTIVEFTLCRERAPVPFLESNRSDTACRVKKGDENE